MMALKEVEKIVGPGMEFECHNGYQEDFVKNILPRCRDDSAVQLLTGLDVLASQKPEDINAYLNKIRAPVRLDSMPTDIISIIAGLNIFLKVMFKVQKMNIEIKQGTFSGMRIESNNVKLFKSKYKGEKYTVARIGTDRLGSAFVISPGKQLEYDLLAMVDGVFDKMEPDDRFGGLVMPAINLTQFNVMHWLNGIEAVSGVKRYRLSPAYQYIRLELANEGVGVPNEEDLRLKPDFEIRDPFIFCCGGYTYTKPLIVAYITHQGMVRAI